MLPRRSGLVAAEETFVRRIILFELNEVPFRIIDRFCEAVPGSALARRLPSIRQYETRSEDPGPLSPWKTWPTVHRGVTSDRHRVHDFGQDLTKVDRAYPPLWKLLAAHGVRVGVFGSLHSYPMPASLENYVFYVPDTFAASPECFPDALSVFQAFNLDMARASPRNVARRIPWKPAARLLARSPALGLRLATLGEIGRHLAAERLRQWKTARRRTYQTVLAFDVFMRQLQSVRPQFATFFTNHVASSMHRYWAASFPGDYENVEFPEDWMDTYAHEIDFSMSKFDRMFGTLADFVDANPEYVLWVTSSMGQEATDARPLETETAMRDPEKFMKRLGLEKSDWESRPAMFPDYVFAVHPDRVGTVRGRLKSLRFGSEPATWTSGDGGFLRITLGSCHEQSKSVRLDGREVSFEEMGLENMRIDDRSGGTAYHVPSGSLLIYDPAAAVAECRRTRPQVSTLEIAPAILKSYAAPVPDYMKSPAALAIPNAASSAR